MSRLLRYRDPRQHQRLRPREHQRRLSLRQFRRLRPPPRPLPRTKMMEKTHNLPRLKLPAPFLGLLPLRFHPVVSLASRGKALWTSAPLPPRAKTHQPIGVPRPLAAQHRLSSGQQGRYSDRPRPRNPLRQELLVPMGGKLRQRSPLHHHSQHSRRHLHQSRPPQAATRQNPLFLPGLSNLSPAPTKGSKAAIHQPPGPPQRRQLPSPAHTLRLPLHLRPWEQPALFLPSPAHLTLRPRLDQFLPRKDQLHSPSRRKWGRTRLLVSRVVAHRL